MGIHTRSYRLDVQDRHHNLADHSPGVGIDDRRRPPSGWPNNTMTSPERTSPERTSPERTSPERTSQERRWYLARDGRQYGPFSDADLAKYHAAGQLAPTDFLWHEALPNWRSALVLFPPQRDGPVQAPPTRDQRRPAPGFTPNRTGSERPKAAVWRRRAIVALIALLCSALVGAGNGYLYRHLLLERSLLEWGR
jgi:hypothetical protein